MKDKSHILEEVYNFRSGMAVGSEALLCSLGRYHMVAVRTVATIELLHAV